MSAEARQNGDDVRGAIDALADRVDTLAAIVRETAGSLSASRGEVASLDRRVQERIGKDTQRSAEALVSVRGEIDALRAYVADAGKFSGTVAVAASEPLQETVATLTDRIETLAEIIRSTAGRLVAEQSRISALTEALAKGDQRVEARFAELQRDLRLMSEQAARVPAAPPPSKVDPGLEKRVEAQVGSLAERIDFLSGTVKTTAGQLAARDGELAKAEQERREELARSHELVRSVREDLATLKERLAVDPLLQKRVDGLADTVEALGDRVTTLSGIVGETAGRRTGRETEIAALDERLGVVGTRIDDVARELRREIEALTATAADGAPARGSADIEVQVEAFGEQLGRLEVVVEDASGAAEQVGLELRKELAVLAAAVERERIDLDLATSEWEARRAALEERMDELAAFATSTAERGADEMGRALHTLADRLEALERDRLEVATDATVAESAWAGERAALEARLDAIASSISEERSHAPEVEQLVDDLAIRLARMEDERETVADLAALAETWTVELAALEMRVGEGLSTLEERSGVGTAGTDVGLETGLSESVDELTERIAQIERDRDAVRGELARTAEAWASERLILHEHVSELAAFATSTAVRGADEMGQALHTLAERLERLELDRREVASDATHAESVWAVEREALEARLDSIAAAISEARPQGPEVGLLIDESAGRLARMESERETVADLAALADTWTAELAALEARVDEGLSSLEEQVTVEALGASGAESASWPSESLDELTQRIEQIERDRDAVRDELARTATSWATERASLQERVSELAARIVTGPMPAASEGGDDTLAQTPKELDQLRIGVEGLRMRLAYHEKTVSDLAGSRGVVQRLDELSARLDELAAIVAAGLAPAGDPAGNTLALQLQSTGTYGLMAKLADEVERTRNESREKMLDQMEKIASRMDWRLQRLEASVESPAGVN